MSRSPIPQRTKNNECRQGESIGTEMTEVTELLRSETIGKKEDQRPDRHRREPDHEEQPYHDPLDTEYGRKQFVHFLCRRDQL